MSKPSKAKPASVKVKLEPGQAAMMVRFQEIQGDRVALNPRTTGSVRQPKRASPSMSCASLIISLIRVVRKAKSGKGQNKAVQQEKGQAGINEHFRLVFQVIEFKQPVNDDDQWQQGGRLQDCRLAGRYLYLKL